MDYFAICMYCIKPPPPPPPPRLPSHPIFIDATVLFEEAMKEGSVNISIIKCLVLGIAGVGKTHLKWLLLSENTDKHAGRVSTGIADNPVHAFVGSVKSILAGVGTRKIVVTGRFWMNPS